MERCELEGFSFKRNDLPKGVSLIFIFCFLIFFILVISDNSIVSVDHLFLSFFLSLLPRFKSFVTLNVWSAISNVIDDSRLTDALMTPKNENTASGCQSLSPTCSQTSLPAVQDATSQLKQHSTTQNASPCNESRGEEYVCAVLRLREILNEVQNFCAPISRQSTSAGSTPRNE